MAEELNVNVTGFNLPPIEVKGTFTFPPIRIEGQNGKSAYELWLEAGNTGTREDFLNSLKGTNGNPGLPGKDASTEGAYEMLLGLNVYCENSTPNEVLKGLIRGLGDVIKKQPKPFNFKRPSQGQTYISVSGTPYFRVALLGRGFAAAVSLGEDGIAQVPLDEPFNTKDVELEYFNMLGSIVGTYRVSGYASGEVTGPDFGAFAKDVQLTSNYLVQGTIVAGTGKVYEKGVKVIPTTLETTNKFSLETILKGIIEQACDHKNVENVELDLTQLPNSPAKGGNFPEKCNKLYELVNYGNNTIVKVNRGQVITVSEDPMTPNQTGVATSIKFTGVGNKKIKFNGSELITMEQGAKYEYVFATDTINKVG
ncbi:hypothetical protein [Veillonella parvula]|jgi:hypothetical protein|uniref:hypothetical protein n=1 Tax=Veillonella parvula TaxID=29466 RepID=UPI0028EDE593|nr:hypothetical protein [Veillonella parvula]